MTQLSLTYSPDDLGRAVWIDELVWARKAVDAIGHKNVAFALDVAPSTLTDALAEREAGGKRKALKGEWIAVIRHMAPVGMQLEWLRIVARPLSHEPMPIRTRTPEQRLADLERLLTTKLGDIGAALVAENG